MLRKRRNLNGLPALTILLVAILVWWWLRRRSMEKTMEKTIPAFKAEPAAPHRLPEMPDPLVQLRPNQPLTSVTVPSRAFKAEPAAPDHLPEVSEPVPETGPSEPPAPAGAPPISEAVASTAEAAPSPDNLTRIEGIGPKISGLLQAAGITTFAHLAATEVSQLQQLLQQAGLRLANPSTWPEQAKLAAAGDWDGLKTLQSQLKGGRRTQ